MNKYGVKCGRSLRFWENKGWINKIDPYGWFQLCFRYWLGRRSNYDKRQINRWKKIMSRFSGKLVKMIRDAGSKFEDYSISHSSFKVLSINSFVPGNVLLTAFKTAKAVFSRVLSILTTRVFFNFLL